MLFTFFRKFYAHCTVVFEAGEKAGELVKAEIELVYKHDSANPF